MKPSNVQKTVGTDPRDKQNGFAASPVKKVKKTKKPAKKVKRYSRM